MREGIWRPQALAPQDSLLTSNLGVIRTYIVWQIFVVLMTNGICFLKVSLMIPPDWGDQNLVSADVQGQRTVRDNRHSWHPFTFAIMRLTRYPLRNTNTLVSWRSNVISAPPTTRVLKTSSGMTCVAAGWGSLGSACACWLLAYMWSSVIELSDWWSWSMSRRKWSTSSSQFDTILSFNTDCTDRSL